MSQFPIPAPRSDEGTLLPAILLGLLISMILIQLQLARGDAPVPAPKPMSVVARYRPPQILSVAIAPAILGQPIFTPARTSGSDQANPDLLGGAKVAGAWSVGRQVRLVLRKADGGSVTMSPGDMFEGWQLAGITAAGARFARDGDMKVIPYGASAPASTAKEKDESEEEGEE